MYNISPEEGSVSYHGKAGGQSNPSVSRKELDTAIANIKAYADSAVARIKGFRQEVVQTLPEKGDPATLYFVPSGNPQTSNIHDEYIWVIPDIKKGDTFQAHWEKVGSTAILFDIEDKPTLNKLLVTLNPFNPQTKSQFLVSRDPYTAPAAPTMTTGGSYDGNKTITITRVTSGSTIYYTTDGSEPTISSSSFTSATKDVTLNQDNSNEYKEYTVKARAYKNGLWSEQTTTTVYKIYRKLSAPGISISGNKYSTSRTITIASTQSPDKLYYKQGSNDSWHEYDDSSKPQVSSSGVTVYAYAEKAEWKDSASAYHSDTEMNANKCYIGKAANITSVAEIKNLVHSYEQDTLVDSTVETIDFGSDFEYVWFCIPNTAAKNLAVSSGNVPVPLSRLDNGTWIDDDPAGNLIPATGTSIYRVWRTKNRINSTFTFKFE